MGNGHIGIRIVPCGVARIRTIFLRAMVEEEEQAGQKLLSHIKYWETGAG